MNRLLVVAAMGLIILVAFGFYWFQIRPSQIRKDCYQMVVKANYAGEELYTKGNGLYRLCLADHGLRPEDLIVK